MRSAPRWTTCSEKAKKDKKVLLIITDGNDNASNTSLEKVVARCNQSETLVYAIGLFTEEEKHEAAKARRALNELTSTTGGLAFYPKDVSEVQSVASEIAARYSQSIHDYLYAAIPGA